MFEDLLLPYTVHAQLPDTYCSARIMTTERQSIITAELAGARKRGIAPVAAENGPGDARPGHRYRPMGSKGYRLADTNKNGMQDAGEPGVPGIRAKLFRHGQLADQAAWTSTGVNDH